MAGLECSGICAVPKTDHATGNAPDIFDAVDCGDVGLVEAGEDLRLPREPGETVRISREGVWEDLQRDLAVELGVGGLPDLAHAALAEEGGDVVVPEAGAGTQRHLARYRRRLRLLWQGEHEEVVPGAGA